MNKTQLYIEVVTNNGVKLKFDKEIDIDEVSTQLRMMADMFDASLRQNSINVANTSYGIMDESA